jgi:hypothetical protein
MIAWAGIERLRRGMTDALDFAPRPRWPLDAPGRGGAMNVAILFGTPIVIDELPTRRRSIRTERTILERGEEPSRHAAFQSRRLAVRLGHGPLGRRGGDQAAGDRPQHRQPRHHRPPGQAGVDRLEGQHVGQRQPHGHGNEFHSHPGSFWSAVYYVDDGGIDADPSLGGELEFMDPRGPGPAMYAPQLAYGSAGLSVGANEVGAAQGRPHGDVPGLAAAPGAALQGHGPAHLDRLQPEPVMDGAAHIGVVGGGAWGTALACLARRAGRR